MSPQPVIKHLMEISELLQVWQTLVARRQVSNYLLITHKLNEIMKSSRQNVPLFVKGKQLIATGF